MTASLDDDVEAYARLAAELAHAGEARDGVLAAHGLDEASWEALDERWDARLDAAPAATEESVPPLVERHARAFAARQRELDAAAPARAQGSPDPAGGLELRELAIALRIAQRGGRVDEALAARGWTAQTLTAATGRWARQIASQPELAAALMAALASGEDEGDPR